MKTPTLPYAHLNLRRNPFGELEAGQRAALVVADLEPVAQRLREPGYAVQFMAAPGRGKTSCLLLLHRQFPTAPYVRLFPDEPAPPIPKGSPLFIDEVQQLGRRERRRVFRRRSALALATHVDYTDELMAAGMTVDTIRPDRELNDAALREIFTRRLADARRGPGPIPWIADDVVCELRRRCGSDVRSMEGLLYARLQEMKEVDCVRL